MDVIKSSLNKLKVLPEKQTVTSRKIDAGLAAAFAFNPDAVVNGAVRASVTSAELTAWVNVPGFRVNHIAGDIHTFRGATKATVERLAEHAHVISVEGSAQLGPEHQRPAQG